MKSSDLPTYYETDRFQLLRNGPHLWINDRTGLIGRYGPRGIDVHAEGACLDCKSSVQDADASFDRFVDLMLQHHSIDLRIFEKGEGDRPQQ